MPPPARSAHCAAGIKSFNSCGDNKCLREIVTQAGVRGWVDNTGIDMGSTSTCNRERCLLPRAIVPRLLLCMKPGCTVHAMLTIRRAAVACSQPHVHGQPGSGHRLPNRHRHQLQILRGELCLPCLPCLLRLLRRLCTRQP